MILDNLIASTIRVSLQVYVPYTLNAFGASCAAWQCGASAGPHLDGRADGRLVPRTLLSRVFPSDRHVVPSFFGYVLRTSTTSALLWSCIKLLKHQQ